MPSSPSLHACGELNPVAAREQLFELPLALFEWYRPNVLAVQLDQVEGKEEHGRVVRAGMRLIEIRFAVFTAHAGLATHHDRAHRKGVQRLNDARVAVHPIEAATSVEPYPIVAAPGDQAVSVVLDLVHPLRPALASVGCGRKARCDEARRQRTRERAARTHARRLLT